MLWKCIRNISFCIVVSHCCLLLEFVGNTQGSCTNTIWLLSLLLDPWPLRCNPPISQWKSRVLPVYKVKVSGQFQLNDGTIVSQQCGPYYQGEVVKTLRQMIPQLQLLCIEHGQPTISVSDDTRIVGSGAIVSTTFHWYLYLKFWYQNFLTKWVHKMFLY